jgi:hypothetical protein
MNSRRRRKLTSIHPKGSDTRLEVDLELENVLLSLLALC